MCGGERVWVWGGACACVGCALRSKTGYGSLISPLVIDSSSP